MLICRWSKVLFGNCCFEHWTLGETGDKNQRCQNQIAKIGYYVTGNGQRAVESIFGIGYLGRSIVCGDKTRGVITKFQTRPMTLQRTSTTKCPQWHQIQHQHQQHQRQQWQRQQWLLSAHHAGILWEGVAAAPSPPSITTMPPVSVLLFPIALLLLLLLLLLLSVLLLFSSPCSMTTPFFSSKSHNSLKNPKPWQSLESQPNQSQSLKV